MQVTHKIQNPRWYLTIILATLFHMNHVFTYPCCKYVLDDFEPNTASRLFVLAIACAVAEQSFWPKTLRTPPWILLTMYEVVSSLIVINLIFLFIWVPLVESLECICESLAAFLSSIESFLGCYWFSGLVDWLNMECGCSALGLMIALFIFMWMMVATDILCQIGEMFYSMKENMAKYRMCRKCQLSQYQCPENDPCAVICNMHKCQENKKPSSSFWNSLCPKKKKDPCAAFWEMESAFQEQYKDQLQIDQGQETLTQENVSTPCQNPCSEQSSMDGKPTQNII